MLGRVFERLMTPAQRDRFLPQFAGDDRFQLALAEHEPGRETALGVHYHRPAAIETGFTTSAARAGGAWVIDGAKTCVANAPLAKLFAVQASTAGGFSTLLVPRDSAGLSGRVQEGRWFHGTCGEGVFENRRVPAAKLLRAEGRRPPPDRAAAEGPGGPAFRAATQGL